MNETNTGNPHRGGAAGTTASRRIGRVSWFFSSLLGVSELFEFTAQLKLFIR